MGFVSGLLGVGNSGGSFKAQSAPLMQGVNAGQANQAYSDAQSGLNQQLAFLNALQGQNGIGNQASVFNQQQDLANQFQGLANGTGPNPALAQLANTTGQNVAQQAALMAGQRGAGANAGLLARQAAQQGGAIQQNAAGQAAALQAQQQIAAMQGLQQQQNMLGNLAGTQVGQQGNALAGYNQFAQNEQGNLLNALGQYNNANVSNVSQQNSANAAIQGQTAKSQSGLFGGLLGAGASLIPGASIALEGAKSLGGVMGKAHGGLISGPSSFVGQHLKMSKGGAINGEVLAAQGKMVPGKAEVKGDSIKNDKVPAILSPGEIVIPRSVMQSKDPVSSAAKFVQAIMAKQRSK